MTIRKKIFLLAGTLLALFGVVVGILATIQKFDGDQIVLENALPFLLHGVYQRIRSTSYRAFNEHGLEITPERLVYIAHFITPPR